MAILLACCVLLVVVTTVIHYEVLRLLSFGLPLLRIPARAKLIIVIIAAFGSHALQMLLYGGVYYGVIHLFRLGALVGGAGSSLENCLYFSAETFTSLGFGDLLPSRAGADDRRRRGVERVAPHRMVGFLCISRDGAVLVRTGDQRFVMATRRA